MSKHLSASYSQIVDAAAEWLIELEGDTVGLSTRQAFDEWLRRSPEHVRAFLELLTIWECAASTAPTDIDADTVIARFLDARSNVVPLEVPKPAASERARGMGRMAVAGPQHVSRQPPQRVARLFIAAVASVAVTAASLLLYNSHRSTFATRIAEQRSIVLDDGSSVALNTRSRIRVRFSDDERAVDLLEGQALFHVAKDPARPFIVRSKDVRVRAVATQFDVYRKASGTTVTVVEGMVAISGEEKSQARSNTGANIGDTGDLRPAERQPPGGVQRSALHVAPDEMVLSAGEQVSLSPAVIRKPTRADVASATAWTQRRMQFQKTALGEVAEEFNRYNVRQLRIEDPRISAFLVSGTFSSTDLQVLLRFLRIQPGIRVVEGAHSIRIESTELPPEL